MIELLDARGIRWVDGSPAFNLLRMRGSIVGDDFVRHPDAGSFGLQSENNDLVYWLRHSPVIFRLGIVAVFIEIGAVGEAAAAFQFYQLGRQGFSGVLIAQMIRIPEQVGVAIN